MSAILYELMNLFRKINIAIQK